MVMFRMSTSLLGLYDTSIFHKSWLIIIIMLKKIEQYLEFVT